LSPHPQTADEYLHSYSTDSQAEFEYSTHFQTMMAGGVGGGKTHSLIKRAMWLSFYVPNNEGLIGRYTASELETSTKRQFFEEVPPSMILEINKGEDYVTVLSGDKAKPSRIWFRHIHEPKPDKKHLSGMNLGFLAGDQIEDWEEERWNDLMARFRRGNVRRPYMFGVMNPKGHNWCWKRWIKPVEHAAQIVMVPSVTGGLKESRRYHAGPGLYAIVVTTEENFHNGFCADHETTVLGCEACRIAASNYVNNMRLHNPPQWVARMVDSNFDNWTGKIYPEYNEESVHNIDPFPIPLAWPTIVSIDTGGDAPWAIVVLRQDPVGDLFQTHEFYEPTVLISKVAKWIKDPEQSGIRDVRGGHFIMDPENKSAMLELAQHGIYCDAARKDNKVASIYHTAGYMHCEPGRVKALPMQRQNDGTYGAKAIENAPRWWVFRTCYNTRREHANWQWMPPDPRTGESPNRPEDKADHTCDATLYALRVMPPIKDLPTLDPQLEALRKVDQASYHEALHRISVAGRGDEARSIDEMLSTDVYARQKGRPEPEGDSI